MDAFLRQTDILVSLLPSTADTRQILNRGIFEKLNRSGPMGAPVLINAGRGALQNEADILSCLEDGTLGGASLDVYVTEPLPADSPFWTHRKVVLTRTSRRHRSTGYRNMSRQIERFEAGGTLESRRSRRVLTVALSPQHQIHRAVDDGFEFGARDLGAGANGNGVDRCRRQACQHLWIG